jgi:glutaredoxin
MVFGDEKIVACGGVMGNRILPSIVMFCLCLSGMTAYAEVYHYTDSKGAVHFVDDISRVPEQYRGQMKNAQALPDVNVVGRPGPVTYESSTQSVDQSPRKTTSYSGTVEIFMTSWCGYCKKLATFLDTKGIRYTTYDIEKDSSANKTYRELGGRGVPLSRIGSTVVRGFNPEAVLRAVENER